MSFNSPSKNLRSARAPRRGQLSHRRSAAGGLRTATHRLHLETLEGRCLLAFLAPVDYDVGATPVAIVSADFNNDQVQDLAIANQGSNTVSVLLGNADGTFEPTRNSATGAYPVSIAVGDFNADGNLDMATANYDDKNVSVLLGNGDGAFQTASNIDLGSGPLSVAVGDFNGDGLLDLGVSSNVYYPAYYPYNGHSVGTANVLLGNGDGSFSAPNVTIIGNRIYLAVVADLNDDGFDDFVTVNGGDGFGGGYDGISVLLSDSGGYLQGPNVFSTGNDFHSVAAGDLDADGDTDLVMSNMAGNNVSVLLGNGLGMFTPGGDYATGHSPSFIVLGDFTSDGKLDLATADYLSASLSLLYGVGDGTLSPAVNFALGSNANRVAAGDFNGDGWLDVATANSGGGDVSVLINDQSWQSPPPPSVLINDTTVTEGNTGTASAAFTLTLSHASSVDVTVHYATADITATAGNDYTGASGTVTIPAGQTSKTFTIAVKGDRLAESTETFAVNLSTPVNATIDDGQGIGTILDNEPRISIDDLTVTEGNTGGMNAHFTITLSTRYDQAVTVHFATANGSATAGSDYTETSGTVTVAAGATTQTFMVAVLGDRSVEATENFVVNLSGATKGLIVDSQAIGTILDNEPRISISDMSKSEGKNGKTTLFTFTVMLSGAYDQPVTMSYRTANGSAKTSDNDYVAKTGELTFAPGQTTKTITIEVKGDIKREATETFYLDLFGNSGNSLFTNNRGIGTILNDD